MAVASLVRFVLLHLLSVHCVGEVDEPDQECFPHRAMHVELLSATSSRHIAPVLASMLVPSLPSYRVLQHQSGCRSSVVVVEVLIMNK